MCYAEAEKITEAAEEAAASAEGAAGAGSDGRLMGHAALLADADRCVCVINSKGVILTVNPPLVQVCFSFHVDCCVVVVLLCCLISWE